MSDFIKTIQNFAFQYDLWQKGSKIIVGVSGGPDSACLLNVLAFLAEKYEFKLHIAHVNYELRGDNSKKDEELVCELAKKYGIAVSILVPQKSEYEGNLENSLRNIRYDFFEKLRQDLGYDCIAVAHNQDDQAETVLMRIIRGSGLNGLGAMKAKTNFIIRPMLQISKESILSWAKEHKLEYRIDESNGDTKFMRNNIRHELLPYLEKHFNPAIKKTLSTWSVTVAEDYDFIAKEGEILADDICKNKCADFLAQDFLKNHSAIQRQALRVIVQKIRGDIYDVELAQIEEMIKVIKSAKNKSQKAVIGGLNISKKGDKVDIFCKI